MNALRPTLPFPAWDEARAAALDEPGRLLYRSNLLGSDLRITNYGGGNTSAKIVQKDPLGGHDTRVLWVKGSGGDLGSMKLDGFSTLYMDKLMALKGLYRGHAHEDEMVGLLPHCTFNLNPRAASIDTPLHAYLPFAHVDHMHPDAVIAIAAMADGERITRQVFEGQVGWLPWLRPGYELGLRLAEHVARHPGLRGLVLGGHGLFTWGDDAHACYDNTVAVIAQAQAWLQRERLTRQVPSFGGMRHDALPQAAQDATLARVLPVLRGLASQTGPKLAHVDRQPAVMEFVNSRDLEPLAALGTSCPDHFLRTKIRPLILDEAVYALQGAALSEAIEGKLAAYRADYRAYHQRCKRADSPAVRDPNPVIVLLPRIGMVSLARDKATARIAGEFYVNAINVMREASAIDRYVGLSEQDAFDIEYWLLEEGKLAAYRADYRAYHQRCKRADSPAVRDPNPVIVLLPRIGMVSLARDKATARIAGEFYVNAINVMREASAIDRYVGLSEQDAFDIEYWLLEEAKLQRLPKPRPLVGRVALVTGGAGGIGRAIARRLLAEGACVVLADIDAEALASVTADLARAHGADPVRGLHCDVTREASVMAAFEQTAREFGGLDILVSNAGIASAAPIEDTSLELWHRNQSILATGYFLVGREAFRMMKAQGLGGSIVMIASKNGMVASAQASAYCAAKAAEIQLSRSFALEGAPLGIRSNVVNPDAVIRGSKIWTGTWSAERAAANKISEDELEAFYRDRSMLKRSVFPEDIAEAAYFFAADPLSGKSTGNILNVDAGHLAAFTR